jgi:hypothetical protein
MKANPNLPGRWFAPLIALLGIAVPLFSLAIASNRAEGEEIIQTQPNVSAPVVPATPMPAIVVNHNTVNAALIPQSYLNVAAQKNVVFDHHSIGGNIMTGMGTLQSQSPARYSFVSQFAPPSDWFTTHHGTGINIGEFQDGDNYDPASKIAGFNTTMRSGIGNVVNIAFMKFCFLDISDDFVNGMSTWNSYRTMMTSLMTTYPNTLFVWVTDPLEQALSSAYINREKSLFNNALRQYVQTNGGVLLDLADIESHDPNGNLIVDSQGYEALYSGYAQTQDHHLNGAGQQRIASAFWWLFARLSGWDGGTAAPTSTPTRTPTTLPTSTPMFTPTNTPTDTPVSLQVRGHVTIQGRSAQPDPLQSVPVTFTLRLTSGGPDYNYATNTDNSGFFTVAVPAPGTYNWRVKNPQTLANAGTVTVVSGTTNQEMGLLAEGDANNDNCVSSIDFNILKVSFGRSPGQPGYDARADFTGDNIVNAQDFNLTKVNFGICGASPIRTW